MSNARDGMNWAPSAAKPQPVVENGEFIFASAFFDHGHIFGQTNGLQDAGGVCKWAWDPDPERLKTFCEKYPDTQPLEKLFVTLHFLGKRGERFDKCSLD